MILLSATTHSLELVTSSAATTEWTVGYSDFTTAPAFTHGSSQGSVASATDTTIVAAPGSGVTRRVKFISIRNAHASTAVSVTVQKDVSGTEYRITPDVPLAAGESLLWTEQCGLQVFDASGRLKARELVSGGTQAMQQPAVFQNATAAGTRTITDTQSFFVYIGKAPRALSSVVMRYRVTTAAATFVWAEAAVATGAPVIGGNPSLTMRGFADVSAVINSTGLKSTTINVSAGQSINEGDDVWLGLGNDITTAAIVRAGGADDIEMGTSCSAAQRPSLIIGTPTSFTVDTTGAIPLFGVSW